MRKGTRRVTAFFLVFCMVLSLFSTIPARAEDAEDAEPSGLIAAGWLGTYWDEQEQCEKIVLGKDGYPAEPDWENEKNGVPPAGEPIAYTNNKEVSIQDSALWLDYESGGKKTYISANDISGVEYSEESEPEKWETIAKDDLIDKCTVNSNIDEKELVLFKPDKVGYYRFSCKQCKNDDEKLIVHVDFPEIGAYYKQDRTIENLYPSNNLFWDQGFDYTGLKGDDNNKIYLNLYNRYSSDDMKLSGYKLTPWDEEASEVEFDENSESGDSEYMSVKELKDGWYEITFKDALSAKGGFELELKGTKSYADENGMRTENIDASISGFFEQSGLYVTWDGEDRYSGEDVMHYPEGIYPESTTLKFGKIGRDENGKIEYKPLSLQSKEKITIKASRAEAETDGEEPVWNDITDNDCTWNLKDGELEIMSYYQQDYEITVEGEGSVRVHPYIETIEFFTDKVRPADSEPLNTRIRTIKVDEGNTDTVYVMPYIDNNPYAVDIDSLKVKAALKDKDETDVTSTYIIKGDAIKDENDKIIGYPIKITAQAKEDFDIIVTANGGAPDEEQDNKVPVHKNTLSVDINKRSSLQATPPTKTVYTEGETFDSTGMTVKVVYEDGNEELVQEGYTIAPTEPLKTTDKSVTVEYLGMKTTLSITVNPKAQETPQTPPETTTQVPPEAQPSVEGTTLSSQETGEKAEFTVTSDDNENPTVAYKKTTTKKEKQVKIPDTIEVNGITYKVTSIADNAFKGNKTVTKVTVGSNITSIGKNAFANCKKLKTVTISKDVTTVGDNAFKGCAALTKITLPAKAKKIGKNAFSGCKKLKTLTIKSKNLTSKTISKNAFKGITGKTTIKVPASKLAAYKKLFKKKGLAKNVKVTR